MLTKEGRSLEPGDGYQNHNTTPMTYPVTIRVGSPVNLNYISIAFPKSKSSCHQNLFFSYIPQEALLQ
jgi:hypothetical protein